MDILVIFYILGLALSITLHEASHGFAANALGDPTAKFSGRLSLNPLRHIDPIGSLLIPGLLILSQSQFMFGWAKPVPVNTYNLRGGKWGEAIVAGAGPFVNILIAVAFGLLVRFAIPLGLGPDFASLASVLVFMNIGLAIFNMLPIPPLDGSRILKALLPYKSARAFEEFENKLFIMGPILAFGLVFILGQLFWSQISFMVIFLYSLITGQVLI